MLGRILPCGALPLVLAACSSNVADPRQPYPLGPPSEPQHSGEQAEVATTVARALNSQPTFLAAYRYTGSAPEPDGLNDIVYGPNNTVTIRDGASIAGWSISFDRGIVWSPGTKVYPHAAQQFGDRIAVLWSDPSISAGMLNPSFVAYSSLGISQTAFDSVKGTDGSLHFWPGGGNGGIVDSICVALSTNGGLSFPDLFCKRPPDISSAGTDQSAVGIDKDDRVFVVADDYAAKKLDLYELVLGGFLRISVDPQMGTASHTPRIARDQDGELWLAAARSDTNDVRLCHIRPGIATKPGGCDFVGQVTQQALAFPVVSNSNIGNVRTGLTVSFAANRIRALIPATDFYFTYQVSDGTHLHVGATQCRLTTVAPFACYDVPQWGTGTAAQQFQPALAFLDRSELGDGTEPDPQYAFYQIDDPEVAPGHARVKRAHMLGSPFAGVTPSVVIEDLPFAADPSVCTAKYGGGYEYWGDFFGFQAVLGRHVTVYSSDEGLGCSQINNFQGHQLHLQSWFWSD